MALAAIILFDQFPRNIFRDQARAFATDPLALSIARAALDRGFDEAFVAGARMFFYMPFMHSEALADQERALALFSQPGFETNLGFAKAHHAIIARFGGFRIATPCSGARRYRRKKRQCGKAHNGSAPLLVGRRQIPRRPPKINPIRQDTGKLSICANRRRPRTRRDRQTLNLIRATLSRQKTLSKPPRAGQGSPARP